MAAAIVASNWFLHGCARDGASGWIPRAGPSCIRKPSLSDANVSSLQSKDFRNAFPLLLLLLLSSFFFWFLLISSKFFSYEFIRVCFLFAVFDFRVLRQMRALFDLLLVATPPNVNMFQSCFSLPASASKAILRGSSQWLGGHRQTS